MSLDLTVNTRRALSDLSLKPVIALTIEGLPYVFSTGEVKDFIRIGCDGLFVNNLNGDPWVIGGLKPIENNLKYLDSNSSTFTIRQQMNQDEGSSSSVSTMSMTFIDKEKFMTELISPGFQMDDMLGAKARVFVGFGDTSFFLDYNLVFKGNITSIDSGAGNIKIRIDHPDNKKLAPAYKEVDTVITSAMDASQLTVDVENDSNILVPSPFANPDISVQYTPYLKIDDEFMEVVSKNAGVVTLAARGSEFTAASTHDNDSSVSMIHKIEGNPLEIAMAMMLSGRQGEASIEGQEATSFVNVGGGTDLVDNAIFFDDLNIPRQLGITDGDFITISGATDPANNFVNRKVTDVVLKDGGYYIVVDGAPLIVESVTSAVASFASKYDVLPDGLNYTIDEVDVARHESLVRLFFSASSMRFFLEEEIEGRDFIDNQLYKPIACYAVPRKAASSVGYTVGPIPGTDIKTLDITTNRDSDRSLRIIRTTDRAFFNEVNYRFDPALDNSDKFLAGRVTIEEDSKTRITRRPSVYQIDARGVRKNLDGDNIALAQSKRIIDRYAFAAEEVKTTILLRDGFSIEIGDVVIGDFGALQVSDISKGNREFKPRMFEVLQISKNFKTGAVSSTLLDTGFGPETRFGLMSPCSFVDNILSPTSFTIKKVPDVDSIYGVEEWRFWESIAGVTEDACIRFTDPNTGDMENALLKNINEFTFSIDQPLTVVTLGPDVIVEFCEYTDGNIGDQQKLVWGWMQDDPTFGDGSNQYTML